jgi:hypothetical protein
MDVKASGRAAFIVATGLWIGLSGLGVTGLMGSAQAAPPSGTAAADKPAVAKPNPVKKPAKHAVASKPGRVAAAAKSKPSDDKPVVKPVAKAALASAADAEAPLPDTVANANAQMSAAAPASDSAPAPRQTAPEEAQLVASDQLNDLDLAAAAEAAPEQTIGQSTAAVTAMASPDDTLWRQTSLIGKIFIAFGGLLTVASAARMFVA